MHMCIISSYSGSRYVVGRFLLALAMLTMNTLSGCVWTIH